ncbi:uroporphyrinogen-III synthase [Solirhodobacter olei]|uniref:uroporphyrinogen-III synthase n=1 Tax=Solirhodobacter olei TaxID=2493082 RepID=UPI000FD9D938|nr:uroporphyrinogen-III synthase [Solirhodobacter olei]
MRKPAPILLLTRPEAASRRFAEAARARFGAAVVPLIAPLIEITFADTRPDLAGIRGLVFTSENGVAAYLRLEQGRILPAWCVGPRTAEAARAGGLRAHAAGGDVAALAEMLAREGVTGPLLHSHGAHRAGDLEGRLAAAGIALRSHPAYAQEARAPSAEALAALAGQTPVIAPVFSPRSARLFRAAFPAPDAPLRLVALSPAVAEALGPGPVRVAARPDAGAMLDALAEELVAGSTA